MKTSCSWKRNVENPFYGFGTKRIMCGSKRFFSFRLDPSNRDDSLERPRFRSLYEVI